MNSAVECVIFTAIGVTCFGLSFLLIERLTPFSVRKEIEEDQNVALGIMMGAMIIGISLIVASAISG